jgi:hypothetical protein
MLLSEPTTEQRARCDIHENGHVTLKHALMTRSE